MWPLPPCYEVDVFSVPGTPGGSHVVTFKMKAVGLGKYRQEARITSSLFDGVAIASFKGRVK